MRQTVPAHATDVIGYDYSQLLDDFNLRLNLPDAHHHFAAQFCRDRIASAMLSHQTLDDLFQPELPQAWPALVKVLPDALTVRERHLAVQVPVDAFQYLTTRHVVWVPAAHDLPSSVPADSVWAPCTAAPSASARTRPRSTA